jgi:hypothetical protein
MKLQKVLHGIIDHAKSIIGLTQVDNQSTIELDMTDDELLMLFKMAHEADMTFNNFINEILAKEFKHKN